MDKQGKTITIKINGKDRPIQADKKKQDNGNRKKDKKVRSHENSQGDQQESSNYQINNIREDQSKVYPLENEAALNETAAAQEQAEESFDWILPDPVEEEVIKEYKIAPKQAKKQKKKGIGISVWNTKSSKRNNRLYTTIIMNVLFAVLIGTAFGVTFLKFLPSEPDTAAPAVTQPKAGQAAEKPAGGKESLELQPIQTFIVQNGIFTTEAGAKERVELLAGQGVTAELFPANGQFAVYLGTAGTIEAAKQQAETLKAKGVEVFAKPFEIAGGTAAGLAAAESAFLKQAPEIYTILMNGAAAAPEEVKKVEDYQNMLTKIEDKSVADKAVLKAMASMERATAAFVSYQKSKDANQLAEMEKSLLAFLYAYQTIGK